MPLPQHASSPTYALHRGSVPERLALAQRLRFSATPSWSCSKSPAKSVSRLPPNGVTHTQSARLLLLPPRSLHSRLVSHCMCACGAQMRWSPPSEASLTGVPSGGVLCPQSPVGHSALVRPLAKAAAATVMTARPVAAFTGQMGTRPKKVGISFCFTILPTLMAREVWDGEVCNGKYGRRSGGE